MLTVDFGRRWRIKRSQCVGSNKDGETGVFLSTKEMKTGGWRIKKERKKKLPCKTRVAPTLLAQPQHGAKLPAAFQLIGQMKKSGLRSRAWGEGELQENGASVKLRVATKHVVLQRYCLCADFKHLREREWQSHHILTLYHFQHFPQHNPTLLRSKNKSCFIFLYFITYFITYFMFHKPGKLKTKFYWDSFFLGF